MAGWPAVVSPAFAGMTVEPVARMSSCDMRERGEDPDIARAHPGIYDHKHNFSFSRHHAPELCKIRLPSKTRGRRRPSREGAGKTGCALHPRSHVQKCIEKNAHEHTGSAEAVRPSLRNGLRLISSSPR